MPDPRLPDYTHLVPTGPLQDREVDLTHVAEVPASAPAEAAALHFGNGATETVCGLPHASVNVTERRAVFQAAKSGALAAHPRVCDACFAKMEGMGQGAYRSRG